MKENSKSGIVWSSNKNKKWMEVPAKNATKSDSDFLNFLAGRQGNHYVE